MATVPESVSDIKVFLTMAKDIVYSFKPSDNEMNEEQSISLNNLLQSMDTCIELL